jgi:hypothetical protein
MNFISDVNEGSSEKIVMEPPLQLIKAQASA